jgi:hypothetical protein
MFDWAVTLRKAVVACELWLLEKIGWFRNYGFWNN